MSKKVTKYCPKKFNLKLLASDRNTERKNLSGIGIEQVNKFS